MTLPIAFSIDAMKNPGTYSHPIDDWALIETHISWVVLAGEFGYKFKKPIKTPFLDYSSLELRRIACLEELRLNRRYAPEIYLDVVCILDAGDHLKVASQGESKNKRVVEYAVRMHRFEDQCLLSDLLRNGRLTGHQIELLADELAEVHLTAPEAIPGSLWGSPEELEKESRDNFQELREISGSRFEDSLTAIERWDAETFHRLHSVWHSRRLEGHIKECHGDLHLGNLVWHKQRVALFDAIEFNEAFRWIDTMSDLAFVLMDLEDRGRIDFAGRLLNRYLEKTGDYDGLEVLDWYMVYRAMVRAKVAAIRANQETSADRADEDWLRVEEYIDWAKRMSHSREVGLAITYGLSGSGKTVGTEPLLMTGRAIRVRSDIERRREPELVSILDGTEPKSVPESASGSTVGQGLYRPSHVEATYQRMLRVAQTILESGYWAIIDATFLEAKNRDSFARLARDLKLPFHILAFDADMQTLSSRIEKRRAEGTDPSEATTEVLRAQQKNMQPLSDREKTHVIDIGSLVNRITSVGPARE